jgi:hypothetical protein
MKLGVSLRIFNFIGSGNISTGPGKSQLSGPAVTTSLEGRSYKPMR